MILPVYLYGHPVLKAVAKDVTPDYPDLDQLIENMKETMYDSEGIGIAAPQVGVSLRLVYIDVDVLGDDMPELKGIKFVLINPEITILDGEEISREEGCLSVPGIHEKVRRIEKINLKWLDENWQQHEQLIEGYLARVVQHECDHLNCTVFVDHISPIRKQLVKARLNDISKGNVKCGYRTRCARPTRK